MHSLSLLALLPLVAAIDIQGHQESHCRDNNPPVTWTAVNPDTCVSAGNYFAALSFNAIPSDWTIETRGYYDMGCQSLRTQFQSNGATWMCNGADNNGASYGSGGYGFINQGSKRDVRVGKEKECHAPDLVTLKDGRKYTVTGADEGVVNELKPLLNITVGDEWSANFACRIEHAINGTTRANIPSAFDKYIQQ